MRRRYAVRFFLRASTTSIAAMASIVALPHTAESPITGASE